MKDNYKAQDLKFYARNGGEAKQFQERAFELGYNWRDGEKTPSHLTDRFFYLDEFGALSFGNRSETFIKHGAKQITLEEFLAPQRGEMVEVRDNDNHEWEAFEFICDLNNSFEERYVVRNKHYYNFYIGFEQMRAIKKEQPKQESLGMFKAFDETIELLEQAIDGLKKCKPEKE